MVRYVKPVRWELGLPRPKGLLGAPRLVLYSPAVSCSDRLGILGLCEDCKDWMGIASLFGCGRGRGGKEASARRRVGITGIAGPVNRVAYRL